MSNTKTKTLDLCLNDLKLNLILQDGFFHSDTGLTPSAHFHSAYELHYLENGSLEMECSGHPVRLSAGDFLLIAPNVSHRMLSCTEPIHRISLQCTLTQQLSEEKGIYLPLHRFFSQIAETRILHFSSSSCHETLNLLAQTPLPPTGSLRLRALLSLVFLDLYDHITSLDVSPGNSAEPPADDLLLRPVRIYDYFSSYFREPITAQDLADELNISKRQLFRFLREKMNTEFSTLLAQQRIAYAIQLMRESTSPQDAALLCGYNSFNGFRYAFQKVTGQTVTEFRKNLSVNGSDSAP